MYFLHKMVLFVGCHASLSDGILFKNPWCHQQFQVPEMEGFLNLNSRRFFWDGVSPYHKPYPYSLHKGENPFILGTLW